MERNISILAIDDDPDFHQLFISTIKGIERELLVSIKCSISSFVNIHPLSINQDLIFLDISMPINGFDIARRFPKEYKIVFMTSHDDLVWRSFEFTPYDFARKQILHDDLKRIINRYLNETSTQIVIMKYGYKQCININSVYMVKVSGNSISVFHDQKETTQKISLIKFIRNNPILDSNTFIRINKSEIINSDYIKSIYKDRITLKNNMHVFISRKYNANVSKKIYTDNWR